MLVKTKCPLLLPINVISRVWLRNLNYTSTRNHRRKKLREREKKKIEQCHCTSVRSRQPNPTRRTRQPPLPPPASGPVVPFPLPHHQHLRSSTATHLAPTSLADPGATRQPPAQRVGPTTPAPLRVQRRPRRGGTRHRLAGGPRNVDPGRCNLLKELAALLSRVYASPSSLSL